MPSEEELLGCWGHQK